MKAIIAGPIELMVTFNPTLAKNTGESNIKDTVSNLEIIYEVLLVPDNISPATKAPVISETPKNASEQYAIRRQNTKLKTLKRRKSFL